MLQLVPPGVPELWESVHEEHQGLGAVALLNVVHLQTGEVDVSGEVKMFSKGLFKTGFKCLKWLFKLFEIQLYRQHV